LAAKNKKAPPPAKKGEVREAVGPTEEELALARLREEEDAAE
jgi:hypothetical protein